jgi:putative phage-type endonuclease
MDELQRSQAWFEARLGKATASKTADILAKVKSGEAATRRNYRIQLVCERITGTLTEHFTTRDMEWGTEQEPFARAAYEAATGNFVDECGSVDHSTIPMFAASPDGLVGKDGLIEIKCPYNSAVHLETWLNGMPEEHQAQVQGQMWLTGRDWCDFVSFDPRMPDDLQLYVQRVQRNPEFIAGLEREIITFLGEVDAIVQKLQAKTSF